MILFKSISFNSFTYFSTMLKYKEAATLWVMIITPLLLEQIKSVETSDFTHFRSLLIFNIYSLTCEKIASELFVFIGTIICFLNGLLIVMLNFGLPFNPLLFVILWILIILLEDILEKVSLIYVQLLEFNDWIFLENLDLAKTLLLGLEEIEEEILEISACFYLISFRVSFYWIRMKHIA